MHEITSLSMFCMLPYIASKFLHNIGNAYDHAFGIPGHMLHKPSGKARQVLSHMEIGG